MKILITGAKGQLACEFTETLTKTNHDVISLNKEELNIGDFKSVVQIISQHKPAVVLNCAAYNQVDKTEEDFESAIRVNAYGVKNLASVCEKYNALLVHYSTDYVFDGEKEDFYFEEDEPNPISKYGESKLMGERFLREETEDFLLFRVSWVFGKGKQNFIYKLNKLAKNNRVLRVVCDQISVPTYTEDIVKFTMLSVEKGMRGLYHLTNSGYASRYEVARYYFEQTHLAGNMLLPVDSEYFTSPVRRPYFSAMSNLKLSRAIGKELPHWKDAINRFIKRELI